MEGSDGHVHYTSGAQPSSYLRVVLERKWIVIVVIALAVGLALGLSLVRTPMYQATATVVRETAALDQTLFGTSVFQLQDASRQLQTGANLVRISAVGKLVQKDLGTNLSIQALVGMVTVSASAQSDLLRISAKSAAPEQAAAVANSFAYQFIEYRRQANRAILAAADAKIVQELATMSSEELKSERGVTLAQKHEELGILASMQTGGFEVVQEASIPLSTVTPRPLRDTGLAFIGSLLLGLLLAFGMDYFDRRIKDEESLEKAFSLPVLTSTPRVGYRWARGNRRSRNPIGFSGPQSPFLEAFRTLRSNLRFFQIEKRSRTIMVTSGLPKEGKTVTVVNLAISLAMSGARVILLEADLRRPMLHEYLNLPNTHGVSTVLVGATSFGEAVQVVRVPDFVHDSELGRVPPTGSSDAPPGLLCLTSGPLPPNPAELLSTPRMVELLKRAAAHADYVLIDTPPILLVSDALTLAEQVDGLIVVVRLRKTTFDQARDMRAAIDRSGLRALGIVANDARRGKSYYHGNYGGYYSKNPH